MVEIPTDPAIVEVVLASGSPRRRQLFNEFGFAYRCWVPGSDEDHVAAEVGWNNPEELVRRLATAKLNDTLAALSGRGSAAARSPEFQLSPAAVVIAADTVVVNNGVVVDKPRDRMALREAMDSYSGNSIVVMTAVVVAGGRDDPTVEDDDPTVETATTRVSFRPIADEDIVNYVASGEGDDKAGGLSLQGGAGRFIASVKGCWTNVVGLPLCVTGRLLRARGVSADACCLDRHGQPCP